MQLILGYYSLHPRITNRIPTLLKRLNYPLLLLQSPLWQLLKKKKREDTLKKNNREKAEKNLSIHVSLILKILFQNTHHTF